MALTDVLAKTTVTGFTAGEETTIRGAITTAYNGSATASAMFEAWIATVGNTIQIDKVAGAFQAYLNTGRLEIDLNFLTNASYIDNKGNAAPDTAVTAIVHELVHAIDNKSDNWDMSLVGDYRGDTVVKSNIIYKELGLPEQNSYIAYDSTGNVLTPGKSYTNGATIDRSISGDANLSTAPAGNSNDLVVGGPSANNLQTGNGNDFLFGNGGNDALNGGGGRDTAVLSGNPVDYDIRLNADGTTWTSRHVRSAADEGTDTFANLERVMFGGNQTYNLTKGGLTFQTDFAFVVDGTGSMFDDIAAVKASANGVINALFGAGTIDARIGVVSFRDNFIGQPTQIVLPFTDQDQFAARQSAAIGAINSLGASGGGDFPESAFDGLLQALNGSMGDWRDGAGTKRIALFTDASAKDAGLAPTVAALAADLGVSITGSATRSFGEFARSDVFTFAPTGAAARDPLSEGDGLIPYLPDDAPATPVGGTSSVQITTIFIDTFISPDPPLVEIAEGSGGSALVAADPDEVVALLLALVETANYTISVDTTTIDEDDPAGVVSFTIARDRADETSTVTLGTFGTAGPGDVGPAPSSIDFAIGQFERTITISIVDDAEDEPDETFGLQILSTTEDSSISVSTAAVTIVDDDGGSPPPPPPPPSSDATNGPDHLVGTHDPNEINGLGGNDTILGAGGDDRLKGSNGNDTLKGSNGNDTMNGGSGNDIMNGGRGDDRLTGSDGDDRITGSLGNDTLIGGAGNNVCIGGAGADKFVFGTASTGFNKVNDFDPVVDILKLHGVASAGADTGYQHPQGWVAQLDNGGEILFKGLTEAQVTDLVS